MNEEKDRQDEDTEGNMPLRQPRGVSAGGTEEEDAEGQGEKLADEETEQEDPEGQGKKVADEETEDDADQAGTWGVGDTGDEDTEGQGGRRP